jgi:nanoRNase/pAp phosphatase (c-di-AMP/oligoRNAs hydrolase)
MKNYPSAKIKEFINGAATITIVVPQMSVDSIGAALAFAISLEKTGKKVSVFCPHIPDANYQNLSGLDKVKNKIDADDLVISLDYPIDQIEKVSYNENGGQLNLVVQTKDNAAQVQKDQIIIKPSSNSSDLNFIFGEENTLGENSKMINRGTWVYLSPLSNQKPWAALSLIDPDAPYSEILTFLIDSLKLPFNEDVGKNLLIGLRVATQSFSVNVSPESFEAGAICLSATQPESDQSLPVQPIQTTPLEAVEKSKSNPLEGTSSTKPDFGKPQILKGSTTPRA